MEASALQHAGIAGLHGRSPLLRLQSDERLVALTRRGSHHAFEALVARYQSRLLAFCRHMLSSREDAEDVLQEVFAAAFNAMLADEREINVRPWLYRIARNRSLNHLRRAQTVGVDSMDVHLSEGGLSTADKVHRREEFRLLVADVQDLPETQRTALLLREIDALSYEQISEAMETTVPSVKSLLVRARVALAEAAEARLLSCEEVRLELGEVAEGLRRVSPPVRRHLRSCDRCAEFRRQLRQTNRALAALFPVGPLMLVKKSLLAHLGTTAAAGGGSAAAGGGAAVAGSAAGGVLQAGLGALATKAAAGLAAAAIVTAGAVEVQHAARHATAPAGPALARVAAAPAAAAASTSLAAPAPAAAAVPQDARPATPRRRPRAAATARAAAPTPARRTVAAPSPTPTPTAANPVPAAPAAGATPVVERDGGTATLPIVTEGDAEQGGAALPPDASQPTLAATESPSPPAASPDPSTPSSTPAPTSTPAPAPTPDPTAQPEPSPAPEAPPASQ